MYNRQIGVKNLSSFIFFEEILCKSEKISDLLTVRDLKKKHRNIDFQSLIQLF